MPKYFGSKILGIIKPYSDGLEDKILGNINRNNFNLPTEHNQKTEPKDTKEIVEQDLSNDENNILINFDSDELSLNETKEEKLINKSVDNLINSTQKNNQIFSPIITKSNHSSKIAKTKDTNDKFVQNSRTKFILI